MKTTEKIRVILPAKLCAFCGKEGSKQLGGVGGFSAAIAEAQRTARIVLAVPDSKYAHVACLNNHRDEKFTLVIHCR